MPRYGYGSGGPAEYAMFQQGRRDDQIRNILNMMLSIKQAQEERGWKEREWDYTTGQDAWRRGLEEQKASAQIDADTALAEDRRRPPTTLADEVAKAKAIAQAQAEGRSAGGDKSSEPKPTDYDKKVKQAERLFKAGKMTEQEYSRVLTGYSEDVTPRQDKQIRVGVDLRVKQARAGLSAKYAGKINKKTIAQIKQVEGLNPDFPMEYDLARHRVLENVGDEADAELIAKYDEMFRFFNERLLGKVKKEEFLAKDIPGIDKNAVAAWYDFYK